jgi:hypothetical protein
MHGVDLSIHSLKTSDRITKISAIQKRLLGGDSYLTGKFYKHFLKLIVFLSGTSDGGSKIVAT